MLSTGDEIRARRRGGGGAPDLRRQPADADRDPAALADGGGRPRPGADDAEAVAAALDRGAAEADAILTSGGASAGDEDHVAALLKARGALATWRIAVKPGRPLALGTLARPAGLRAAGQPGGGLRLHARLRPAGAPAARRRALGGCRAGCGCPPPSRSASAAGGASTCGRGSTTTAGSRSSPPRARGGSPGSPGPSGLVELEDGPRAIRARRSGPLPALRRVRAVAAVRAAAAAALHRRGLRDALHDDRRAHAVLAALARRLGPDAGGGRRSTPRSASRCGWSPGWRSRRSPTGSTAGATPWSPARCGDVALFLAHLGIERKGVLLAATLAVGATMAGIGPIAEALGVAAARGLGLRLRPGARHRLGRLSRRRTWSSGR